MPFATLSYTASTKKWAYGNNGYIFLNKKGRVTAPSLNKRIRRYCRKIGISEKGMQTKEPPTGIIALTASLRA